MLVTEKQLHNIVREVLKEYHVDYRSNQEYIISMLKKGYLAHGTPTENLTSFDESNIIGGNRGEYGYGFYFTDEMYKCLEYGSEIYFTPKNIYNFFELDGRGNFQKLIQNHIALEQEIERYKQDEENLAGWVFNNYEEYWKKREALEDEYAMKNNYIMYIAKEGVEEEGNVRDEYIFKYIKGHLPIGRVKELSNWLMSYGYDGVHSGNQYCIFNTNKLNSNIIK